jgi:hypothetical protein
VGAALSELVRPRTAPLWRRGVEIRKIRGFPYLNTREIVSPGIECPYMHASVASVRCLQVLGSQAQ